MLRDGSIKIARGAEWDFSFDMLGAVRGGRMDFAATKTIIDFVDGCADIFGAVEAVLVKSKLLARLALKLI